MKNDITIIGGGIVGLATAWSILKARPATKLLLLEKEEAMPNIKPGTIAE